MIKGLSKFLNGFKDQELNDLSKDFLGGISTFDTCMIHVNSSTVVKRLNDTLTVYFDEVDGKRMSINLDLSVKKNIANILERVITQWSTSIEKYGYEKPDDFCFIHLKAKSKPSQSQMVWKCCDSYGIDTYVGRKKIWEASCASLIDALHDINFDKYNVVDISV